MREERISHSLVFVVVSRSLSHFFDQFHVEQIISLPEEFLIELEQ